MNWTEKRLNHHLYALIERACKIEGTYDPMRLLPYFEEALTIKEAEAVASFLQWCHENGKTFGHGNYQERWDEWNEWRKWA